MQVHISPNMRRITISTTPGFFDPLKMKSAVRYLSYRCLFWTILALAWRTADYITQQRKAGVL